MTLYGMTHPRVHLVPTPPCLPAWRRTRTRTRTRPQLAPAGSTSPPGHPGGGFDTGPGRVGFDILVPIEYSILNIQY